jgi:hypothetical protein
MSTEARRGAEGAQAKLEYRVVATLADDQPWSSFTYETPEQAEEMVHSIPENWEATGIRIEARIVIETPWSNATTKSPPGTFSLRGRRLEIPGA